jgi:hypothetical protein
LDKEARDILPAMNGVTIVEAVVTGEMCVYTITILYQKLIDDFTRIVKTSLITKICPTNSLHSAFTIHHLALFMTLYLNLCPRPPVVVNLAIGNKPMTCPEIGGMMLQIMLGSRVEEKMSQKWRKGRKSRRSMMIPMTGL